MARSSTRRRRHEKMHAKEKPALKAAVRKGPQHRTIQRWTLPIGIMTMHHAKTGGVPFCKTRKEAVKMIPKRLRGEIMPVLTTIKLPLRYAPTTD